MTSATFLSLLLLAFVSLLASPSEAKTKVSYRDLKQVIETQNHSILALKEHENVYRGRVPDIKNSFLPKVGVETGIVQATEANGLGDTAPFWKIDLSTNLYRAGRDGLHLRLQQSLVLRAEAETNTRLNSELLKTQVDYIELYSLRKTLALTQASMDDYDSLKKIIRDKARAGLMTATAVDMLDFAREEWKREEIALKAHEHELEDRLALHLGLQTEEGITIDDQITLADVSGDHPSLGSLPELKKFDLEAETKSIESKIQYEWWRPDIDAFASHNKIFIDETNEFRSLPQRESSFGIRASFDLRDKGSLRLENSTRRFEIKMLEHQKSYVTRELEHQIHELHREVESAEQLALSYRQSLSRSETLLKKFRREFERGVADHAEIRDLIRERYELSRKEIETKASILKAKAGLELLTQNS